MSNLNEAVKLVSSIVGLTEQAPDFSGSMMIALLVPDEVTAKLKELKIADEDVENLIDDKLHVTLLYLGKDNTDKRSDVLEALNKSVSSLKPIKCSIGGFGVFSKGEHGVPYFATIDAKGLNLIQAAIETSVSEVLPSQSEHGFFPHMTLGYKEDENVPLPTLEEDISWEVSSVFLCVGGDYTECKFGG